MQQYEIVNPLTGGMLHIQAASEKAAREKAAVWWHCDPQALKATRQRLTYTPSSRPDAQLAPGAFPRTKGR